MKNLLLVLLLCNTLLFAKTEDNATNDEYVNINFVNLRIVDFVKMVAKIRHKNILMNTNLKGKINFVSVKPVPKTSLMKLLNSILETKGFTLINTTNGYLKIVKIANAGRSGLPVNEYDKNTYQIVTEIIEVDDINVDLLITKLRHLVTKGSKITTSRETNAIIVTDYPDKIRSIKKIIKLLVSKTKQTVVVVELHSSIRYNIP